MSISLSSFFKFYQIFQKFILKIMLNWKQDKKKKFMKEQSELLI